MMAILERSWRTPMDEMSAPSTLMAPLSSSISRNTELISELLPAPVCPRYGS